MHTAAISRMTWKFGLLALMSLLTCILTSCLDAEKSPASSSNAPRLTAAPVAPAAPAREPTLFLVGDSIMKTGTPPGDRGAYGMGYEIAPYFDPAKIHVDIEGLGGRSSRGYIEEGAWATVLDQMHAGDYLIIMFGHNDAKNSANYPDRATVPGNGDELGEVDVMDSPTKKSVHSYGWYLRQYVKDAKAKGVTPILCSPVPRNQWNGGKIKRGFDGYAQWAAAAAKQSGALFIDLNTYSSDTYDALGQQTTVSYFADVQHTTKAGAKVNAASMIKGIKLLKDCPLMGCLLPEPAKSRAEG